MEIKVWAHFALPSRVERLEILSQMVVFRGVFDFYFEKIMTEKTKIAYSVAELSEELALSKSFIRKEIRLKKLPAKKVGRRVLVLSKEVENYLKSQEDFKPTNEKTDKEIL